MAIEQALESDIPASMKAAYDSAKATHPDLFVLRSAEYDVTVVCTRPTRALYRKFREEQDGGPTKSAHRFENLFTACLVVPSVKEFDAVLDRLPAIGDAFGVTLWDKCCGTGAVSAKKA